MVRKIINVFTNVVIVLLVVIILFNVFIISNNKKNSVPSIFGYKFLVDLTNSMLPEISSGDLIVIKKEKSYKVGDIIAYRNKDNSVITHRVIGVKNIDGKKLFQVKGDNNNFSDDEDVSVNKIEGAYVTKIHKVGHLCLFFTSTYGIVFIFVIVILYLIYLITSKYLN